MDGIRRGRTTGISSSLSRMTSKKELVERKGRGRTSKRQPAAPKKQAEHVVKENSPIATPKVSNDEGFHVKDMLYINELMFMSDGNLSDILHRVVNVTGVLIRSELLCFFRVQQDTKMLRCEAEMSVYGNADGSNIGTQFEMENGIAGFVQKTGRIVSVTSPMKDWRYDHVTDRRKNMNTAHSCLVVPIRDDAGATVAVLEAWNAIKADHEPADAVKEFTLQEESILKSVSCALSSILHRFSLQEALDKQQNHLLALQQITSLASARLPLRDTIRKVMTAIRLVVPVYSSVLFIVQEDQDHLAVACALTISDDEEKELKKNGKVSYPLRIGGTPASQCATSGVNVVVKDIWQDWRFNHIEHDGVYSPEIHAVAAIPIKDFLGKVLCVLEMARTKSRVFSDDEIEQAGSLCAAATSVIRQAQLAEQRSRIKEESTRIARLTEMLSQDVKPAAVIPQIIDAAYSLTGADRVSMFNVEDLRPVVQQGGLRRKSISVDSFGSPLSAHSSPRSSRHFSTRSMDFDDKKKSDLQGQAQVQDQALQSLLCIVSKDASMQGRKLMWGQGIVGHAAMTKKLINVKDAYNDPRFYKKVDKETHYKTQSVLVVPVMDRSGQLLAVIQAMNKTEPSTGHFVNFTTRDEEVLQTLATNASVALTNCKTVYAKETAERKYTALLSLYKLDPKNPLRTTLDLITEVTKVALDCEHVGLFFVNNDRTYFNVRKGSSHDIDTGIAGLAATTGHPINVHRAQGHPNFHVDVDQYDDDTPTVNMLYMPVVDNNGVALAVMQCVNKRVFDMKTGKSTSCSGGTGSWNQAYPYFTIEDELVLGTLADRVLVAIRSLRVEALEISDDQKDERVSALIDLYRHVDDKSERVDLTRRASSFNELMETESADSKTTVVYTSLTELKMRDIASHICPWPTDGQTEEVQRGLAVLHTREFNVFDYSLDSNCIFAYTILRRALSACGEQYMTNDKYIQNFVMYVRGGYRDNPYHNFLHGFGVMQFCYYAMEAQPNLLCPLLKLALLTASIAHDVDHPGNTNTFQVNTSSELSCMYNDKAVLENYHASLTFRILQDPDCRMLEKFHGADFNLVRASVIDGILATDMTMHFDMLKQLNGFETVTECEPQFIFNAILHGSDIAAQCFPIHVAKLWEVRIGAEFSEQAAVEEELGLQPAAMMQGLDDFGVRISLHLGFIDHVLKPWFCALARLFTCIEPCAIQLQVNREVYADDLQEFRRAQ